MTSLAQGRGPSSSADPVFSVRGLTKVYQMGEVSVHALRGVDLDVPGAQLLVLLGPSGSGKSTLLNILGGLDSPTSGTVHYRGRDLTHAGEAALTAFRRHAVGFVFQFYNLMPSLTARENVELATEIADDPLPADDALGLVGLSARLDHFPAQLSGGEQQRVAIARSRSGPTCCSAMSRLAPSTSRPAQRCSTRSCGSMSNSARP
jgi:putative ABC transport system ATP-binding protein